MKAWLRPASAVVFLTVLASSSYAQITPLDYIGRSSFNRYSVSHAEDYSPRIILPEDQTEADDFIQSTSRRSLLTGNPYDSDEPVMNLNFDWDAQRKWDAHHSRRLKQSASGPAFVPAPAPAPTSAHGVLGQPDSNTVYTIVNNNDGQFGVYVCIDSCAHGNTCVWGNAWLWMCNGTNPTHHYWVWEPDTLIIRSATTDSFQQYPEICLEMCTDARIGNGACAMTGQLGSLNVGFSQCTGATNQQFTLNGTQIISVNNSQCMAAGAQPCGRFSNCNKGQAQARRDNYVINVFMLPCDRNDPNQQWTLGPAPNSTLINFTPLNESASEFPPTVANLSSTVLTTSNPSVINFVSEANPELCLSIENQASCQSSQQASTIINPLSQVCVWDNALLQTCWSGGSDAAADEGWFYDNTTGIIGLAVNGGAQNACLEMCSSQTFARGACSLAENNVILQPCSGGPAQQFDFNGGILYNEFNDLCVAAKPYCLVDYTVPLNTSADTIVNGFRIGNCATQVANGPWSALPWKPDNGGPLGIQNLVGADCDSTNLTFFTRPAGLVSTTDPVAPKSVASAPNAAKGGSSNAAAIAGGVAGGTIFLLVVVLGSLAFWIYRKRKAVRLRMEEEFKIKMYNSGKLNSQDSDLLLPAKRRPWYLDMDLGDEINPNDIEICTHEDGSEMKLGEGAFGTVYRAHRFGVQPVAVKALREESSKQIENFQREIELLRGLRDNNIVLFLGVCKKDGKLMLVTEFMPGGDLWKALNHQTNAAKYMWYNRGRKIALDVARGLVHLHSREIVHMDLKSPNILLGKDLTAKIADVGLARSINNNQITQMTSIGTMAWAAPELKRNFKIGRKDGPRSVTAKADVFSFGVVLWEVVTAEDPTFSSRQCRVPEECPESVEQLIEDCLDDEPENRPTMKQVFERLKKSAAIPPPGHSKPLPTPMATPAPTPPISRDGSGRSPPKSMNGPRSGPLSGYASRLGLAAALKKKLSNVQMTERQAPRSTMRADCILEEDEAALQEELKGVKTEEEPPAAVSDPKASDDVPDDDSAKELSGHET